MCWANALEGINISLQLHSCNKLYILIPCWSQKTFELYVHFSSLQLYNTGFQEKDIGEYGFASSPDEMPSVEGMKESLTLIFGQFSTSCSVLYLSVHHSLYAEGYSASPAMRRHYSAAAVLANCSHPRVVAVQPIKPCFWDVMTLAHRSFPGH